MLCMWDLSFIQVWATLDIAPWKYLKRLRQTTCESVAVEDFACG